MHRNTLRIALSVSLAMGAAACGGDGATEARSSTLSPAEVRAVAAQLQTLALSGLNGTGGAVLSRSAEGAAPVRSTGTVDLPFSHTAACPRGGTIAVSGHAAVAWDDVARTGSLELTGTSTPASCAADNGSGAVLSFTGDPSTSLHVTASSTNGVPGPITVSQKGAFRWQRSDGAGGSCSLDLTSTVNPVAQTSTTTGSFCGVVVNVTGGITG